VAARHFRPGARALAGIMNSPDRRHSLGRVPDARWPTPAAVVSRYYPATWCTTTIRLQAFPAWRDAGLRCPGGPVARFLGCRAPLKRDLWTVGTIPTAGGSRLTAGHNAPVWRSKPLANPISGCSSRASGCYVQHPSCDFTWSDDGSASFSGRSGATYMQQEDYDMVAAVRRAARLQKPPPPASLGQSHQPSR
jgi:hypothetical protein